MHATLSNARHGDAHGHGSSTDGTVQTHVTRLYEFGSVGLWSASVKLPRLCKGLDHKICITGLACGNEHTLLLSSIGAVYSYGGNNYGQLGLGHRTRTLEPARVWIGKKSLLQMEKEKQHGNSKQSQHSGEVHQAIFVPTLFSLFSSSCTHAFYCCASSGLPRLLLAVELTVQSYAHPPGDACYGETITECYLRLAVAPTGDSVWAPPRTCLAHKWYTSEM